MTDPDDLLDAAADAPDRPTEADLKRRIAALERRVRKHGGLQEMLLQAAHGALEEHLAESRPARRKNRPRRSRSRTKPEAIPQLVLTDWQAGKRTPSYDLETCRERVELAVEKALDWVRIYRESFRIDRLDLLLLGDMVEGETIFEGQVWEIEAPGLEQTLFVSKLIADVVRRIAEEVPEVQIVTAYGNHGRTGRKGDASHSTTNLDLAAYRMAEMQIEGFDGVSWSISTDTYHVHDALGTRVLTTHGDVLRGNPTVNWPRKIPKLRHVIPGGFDVLVHGHTHFAYHVSVDLAHAIGVGSPESENHYARDVLAAEARPSQTMFVVGSHGLIGEHVIYLDGEE